MINESQNLEATRATPCGCEGCNYGQCNDGCALGCCVPLVSSADANAGSQVLGKGFTSAGTWAMAPR